MAILHAATVTPTKPELLQDWLGGPVEILGTYRFDDPNGEVGIEAFVLRQGIQLLHRVLTYRGAPSETATLVTTMKHSVLGERWVYDGTTDPVAVAAFGRAIRGEQEQAAHELWKDGELVEVREPTVRVHAEAGSGGSLVIEPVIGDPADEEATRLVAEWDGGSGVVARLA